MPTLVEITQAIFEAAKIDPHRDWAQWYDLHEETRALASLFNAVSQAARDARKDAGNYWITPARRGPGEKNYTIEETAAVLDELAEKASGDGVSKTIANNARRTGIKTDVLRQAEEVLLYPKTS